MILRTLIATCVLMVGCIAAVAQGMNGRQVRIATEGAYAPWNFTTATGKLEGFEIDLANDLCARMEAKCEIVAQDWDGIIPALAARKYDAIIAAMSITDEREKVIDFTRTYADAPTGWGILKNSSLSKLAGEGQRINLDRDPATARERLKEWRTLLNGKTVGVQGSTVYAQFIERYFKGVVEVREYKTTEQLHLDLAAGRVDAILASLTTLRESSEKPEFKDITTSGSLLVGNELGRGAAIGLRKDDGELKAMFNKAIQAAIDDGTIQRLTQKWFKIDITPRT